MSSFQSIKINKNAEVCPELEDYQYDDDLLEEAILVTPFDVFSTSLGEVSGKGDEVLILTHYVKKRVKRIRTRSRTHECEQPSNDLFDSASTVGGHKSKRSLKMPIPSL